MASAILYVLDALLGLLVLAIIISAVMSWLVAFDVINLRNRFVYSFNRFLDAVTAPVMAPFRRIIPPMGGIDISPIIALLVIQAIRKFLLPMAFAPLQGIIG